MKWRRGISLIETIVILVILLVIVGLLLPSILNPPRPAYNVVCQANLHGLGTAMLVYANDYQNQFPQLPGTGLWSKKLGFAFDNATPNFKPGGPEHDVERTITASWYLLIREADVSPKSFICIPQKIVKPFDGRNSKKLDIVELWDFGSEPYQHVSYAMHNPYGGYPAGAKRPSDFAVAADMSPWFRLGDFVMSDTSNKDTMKNITLLPPYFSDTSVTRDQIVQSNAIEHGREGQNVLFADGHSEHVKTSDVGVKHDNIYTYWSVTENPTEKDIRIGTNPTSRDKNNDAKSADDSFLAL